MAQQQQQPMHLFDREPGQGPKIVSGPFADMAMPSVGAELRDARLGLGQDLSEIASALRIRHAYLEAIEEERFGDLPGPVYAIGFVRAYAVYLGLDGEELVRRFKLVMRFKQEVSGLSEKTDLVFPEPLPERRIPRGAILLISAILALVPFGGWYYLSTRDATISEIIPKVPDRLAHLVSGEKQGFPVADVSDGESESAAAATIAPEAGESAGQPATEESPASARPEADTPESTAPGEDVSRPERGPGSEGTDVIELEPSRRPPVSAPVLAAGPAAEPRAQPAVELEPASRPVGAVPSEPAEAAPAPPESPAAAVPAVPGGAQQTASPPRQGARIYGQGHEESRVIVRAKHDSWIQVRGKNNTLLLTRILRAGDSYRVPNRRGLTLMTGNAGALEILVDGKPVPPIGPFGAVRRNVPLDANRLKAARD